MVNTNRFGTLFTFAQHMCRAWAFALVACDVGGEAVAQCEPPWVPGVGTPGTNGDVTALVVRPDGDVVVGGSFTRAGGLSVGFIARYNPSTREWPTLGAGVNHVVHALAVLPDGDVIVGGEFTVAGGVAASRVARCRPTSGGGAEWSAMGTGIGGPAASRVLSLAVVPSADVIVGGMFFAEAGGVPANRIARYNPATGVWSALGVGTSGWVDALAVLPDGDIIVGGSFTMAGGAQANRIARYSPGTGVWSTRGSGLTGGGAVAYALAVLPDGDVVAGGVFTSAGGVAANGIARYHPQAGGAGVWSALESGVSIDSVLALAVMPDGGLIVGGVLGEAMGEPSGGVVRYDAAAGGGGVWSGLGAGITGDSLSYCTAAVAVSSGDVVVGGGFDVAGGAVANNFARYSFGEPAPSITEEPQDASVCVLGTVGFAVVAEGHAPISYQWRKDAVPMDATQNPTASAATLVLTGVEAGDAGSYDCLVSSVCGSAISRAAAFVILSGGACCPADFNGDGFVDFFDYLGFVEAFETGEGADFNRDGFVDFFDYADFVGAFEAGC